MCSSKLVYHGLCRHYVHSVYPCSHPQDSCKLIQSKPQDTLEVQQRLTWCLTCDPWEGIDALPPSLAEKPTGTPRRNNTRPSPPPPTLDDIFIDDEKPMTQTQFVLAGGPLRAYDMHRREKIKNKLNLYHYIPSPGVAKEKHPTRVDEQKDESQSSSLPFSQRSNRLMAPLQFERDMHNFGDLLWNQEGKEHTEGCQSHVARLCENAVEVVRVSAKEVCGMTEGVREKKERRSTDG